MGENFDEHGHGYTSRAQWAATPIRPQGKNQWQVRQAREVWAFSSAESDRDWWETVSAIKVVHYPYSPVLIFAVAFFATKEWLIPYRNFLQLFR